MAVTNIEDLFDTNRLPEGLGETITLCVYFPLGMLIAILRLFIGFHTYLVACLLPKGLVIRNFVLRTMCTVLGIFITTEGTENRNPKSRVLVANYTSTLDHLAVELVVPNILPCVWDLPPALMWLLGYTEMGAKHGRDQLIENAKKHTRTKGLPLFVFPEGASTNGKKGLLRFSVWPFSLEQPVQPVLIQLHRPFFAKIAPAVLGGRWWIDVFWFLFVPYTLFKIRLLPLCELEEGERSDDYTRRVEKIMADTLNVEPTPFTSADKVEHAKRTLFIRPPPGPARQEEEEDSAVNLMARQVKDVLPQVPMSAIRQDLELTKDIDLTITNLLERRVDFVAEDVRSDTPEPPHSIHGRSPQTSQGPRVADTAAKTFAKSTTERHLSLADRKKQLLENARRRFIEKHGLSVQ